MGLIASILPMQLDLYVQSNSQDPDTGAISKQWNYNQTLSCSAKGNISNSGTSRGSDKQTLDNRYRNEQLIQIRTIQKINIRHKITNIRNRDGGYIWTELNYPSETPTVFEVIGTTPISDPFGNIIGYNTTAKRSESQTIGI
jgi:hypothetical protein